MNGPSSIHILENGIFATRAVFTGPAILLSVIIAWMAGASTYPSVAVSRYSPIVKSSSAIVELAPTLIPLAMTKLSEPASSSALSCWTRALAGPALALALRQAMKKVVSVLGATSNWSVTKTDSPSKETAASDTCGDGTTHGWWIGRGCGLEATAELQQPCADTQGPFAVRWDIRASHLYEGVFQRRTRGGYRHLQRRPQRRERHAVVADRSRGGHVRGRERHSESQVGEVPRPAAFERLGEGGLRDP